MPNILVYSHHPRSVFELLSEGRRLTQQLGGELSAAALGQGASGLTSDLFAYGAHKVFANESPALADLRAEPLAEALAQAAQASQADLILTDSSRRGKELAPRVAQKLSAGCVTNALGLRWDAAGSGWLAEYSALGGNTVATVRLKSPRAVMAMMPGVFELGERAATPGETIVLTGELTPSPVCVIERKPKAGQGAKLEEAEVIIGIGRGVAQQQDLAMIGELARLLGAQIGCTRSLTADYHWLAEDQMIGLSGKRVRPRFYLAIGISGQIQHSVGITDAKLIAAINMDKEAPIFKLCDYGIVGNLYEVTPKLIERLQ